VHLQIHILCNANYTSNQFYLKPIAKFTLPKHVIKVALLALGCLDPGAHPNALRIHPPPAWNAPHRTPPPLHVRNTPCTKRAEQSGMGGSAEQSIRQWVGREERSTTERDGSRAASANKASARPSRHPTLPSVALPFRCADPSLAAPC